MLSVDYIYTPINFWHVLHVALSRKYDALFLALKAGSFVYVYGLCTAWFPASVHPPPLPVRMGHVPVGAPCGVLRPPIFLRNITADP